MNNLPAYGQAYYATATGTVCLTSANAQVIGLLTQGTAQVRFQLFAGTTSTSPATPLSTMSRVNVTASGQAMWWPFPAEAIGGLTLVMGASNDPKLTLFWNPTGGP